jgi:E2F/DP family winged-helix DNA-binding domain
MPAILDDVVNILESIQLVVKKGKNTYTWLGKDYLPDIFGKLQAQAIAEYPEDAVKFGLKGRDDEIDRDGSTSAGGGRQSRRGSMSSVTSEDSRGGFRSLAKLSQQFLQVFLVGYDILSLPQASEMIQGTLSAEAYAAIGTAHAHVATRFDPMAQPPPSLENPTEFRRAAQRGLKTKIRRLYDIANVFLSVGLLRKVEAHSGSTIDVLASNRRPNFQWAYHMSPKQIQEVFVAMKRESTMGLGHPSVMCVAQGNAPIAPLPTSSAAVELKQEERTPSRAEGKIQDVSETPLSSNTSKTPPFSASTNASETEGSEITITPSTNDSTMENHPKLMDGSLAHTAVEGADGSDASRVILANIHQSGGAYHPSPLMRNNKPSVPSQPISVSTYI